jgi:Protein of unknown function (DUF2934)
MNFELDSATAAAPALQPQASTSPGTLEGSGIAAYPDLNSLLAALEHERIAALAYFYWQQRGCPEGSPDDDWIRAEQHIRDSR